MNAERHSECNQACRIRMPLFCMLSVLRKGNRVSWSMDHFEMGRSMQNGSGLQNGLCIPGWVSQFLGWVSQNWPSLSRVVCLYSESQYGHLQVDCSVTNWGASRAPSSCAQMGGSQSRVLTPRNLPRLCAPISMCARGGRAGGVRVGTRSPSSSPMDGGSRFGSRKISGMHKPSKKLRDPSRNA